MPLLLISSPNCHAKVELLGRTRCPTYHKPTLFNQTHKTYTGLAMREFYAVIAGSLRETLEVLSNTDLFNSLSKQLDLPKFNVLFTLGNSNLHAMREFPSATKYALDNGAFKILKSDFDRPFSISRGQAEKWINALSNTAHKYDFAWVALPDIPVHGKRFVHRYERLRRIAFTAWLHSLAYDKIPNPRPVLQGFTLDEYLLSFNLLREKGIAPKDGVYGVGSVCVRKTSSTTKLASGKARGDFSTIEALLDTFSPPAKVPLQAVGLHFFGLHGIFVRTFKDHPAFFSSDSGAHGTILRYEWRDLLRKLRLEEPKPTKYVFAVAIQYVRSTRGLDAEAREVLRAELG